MTTVKVSQMDIDHLKVIRNSVSSFVASCGERFAKPGSILLDIAPQDHEGARPYFGEGVRIETLDINPDAGCTYTGDICKNNEVIPDNRFDYVVCTEVLEHTRRPFDAAAELYRILKSGGLLFISVPFNFRIHGPLPDCWRFTEHGLREVLHLFTIDELNEVKTPERDLMPIHYTVVARKE
jgi:SAM-dependent methyltransferase